jgi:hypothetical protein
MPGVMMVMSSVGSIVHGLISSLLNVFPSVSQFLDGSGSKVLQWVGRAT